MFHAMCLAVSKKIVEQFLFTRPSLKTVKVTVSVLFSSVCKLKYKYHYPGENSYLVTCVTNALPGETPSTTTKMQTGIWL